MPTMGALHEGHLSLIRRTKELCDVLIVSIFVNPTQFGPREDYQEATRGISRRMSISALPRKVDYVFAPESAEEMYAHRVRRPSSRSRRWPRSYEGASRPGHFRGVATVVLKLFEIVQPTIAAIRAERRPAGGGHRAHGQGPDARRRGPRVAHPA